MAANPTGKKAEGGGLVGMIAVAIALGLLGAGAGGYLGYSLPAETAPAPENEIVAGGNQPGSEAAPGKAAAPESHGMAPDAASTKSAGRAGGHGGAHGNEQSGDTGAAQHARPLDFSVMEVRELPPVVTNLGKPETAWIRLQAAIVFDPKEFPHAEKLIPEILADITAYLRSLSIGALEGADGLRRLREELGERVAIRSEHRVREFIIETMVVQ